MRNKKIQWGSILLPALLAAMLSGCGGGGSSSSGSGSSGGSNSPTPPANLVGTWGGGTADNPTALQVTALGGTLNFACGVYDQLAQPLTMDSTGHFAVSATEHSSLTLPLSVQLSGTVSGNTMTIIETHLGGGSSTYTLTYDQQPPAYNGGCPA